ncbi:hypothetical protein GCM10025883_09650 [Mobilicoccus caccae]|uniref:Uncharacterized protein n=1 Tax=Mobilicoccus caccae TaxID=1859295 RepID=A0ABQ6ILW4_9MICO|nr:hypothetical protein GCM10025883_09650 [Mobilicoccus caccae]
MLRQRLHGVTDTDDAVRGPGGDAGQESRPPRREDLVPRLFADLREHETDPVTGAGGVAEGVTPRLRADRVDAAWQVVEALGVGVGPGVDAVALAAAGERLDDHRAVVGQMAVELGAGGVVALEGLVIGAGCDHDASGRCEVDLRSTP